MTKKTIQERYAQLDPRRIVERPQDELEEEYAEAEAVRQARAIWNRFGSQENQRRRVITLLAKEALEATGASGRQVLSEASLSE
jgi:hypothetical protein